MPAPERAFIEPDWNDDALRILVRAGRVLGTSLDTAATLDGLVELLVPAIADAAVIRLNDAADGGAGASSVRGIPEMEPAVRAYVRDFPPTDPAGSVLARAATTGAAVVSNDVDDAWCRRLATSDAQSAGLVNMRLGAALAMPLLAGGRPIGAISLLMSRDDGRAFSESVVLLVEELAARAATAIDHARLFQNERRANERIELLQSVSRRLAEAETVESVAAIALSEGLGALGASMGLVVVPSADGSHLEMLDCAGYAPGVMDGFRQMPFDPAIPLCDAYLRREPIWLSDENERNLQYPAFSSFQTRAGYVAGASIPLVANGRALGVIGLAFPKRHTFDEAERTMALSVANQCAVALARAEATRALRESEARFRNLFELDLIGVMFWSVDGRVLEMNDTLLSLLGYSREELDAGGVEWASLTPPEWREADARSLEQIIRHGRAPAYRKEYFRKDGSRVPVLIGGGLVDGIAGHGAAFVVDLSDASAAEQARQLWADAFEFTAHAVAVLEPTGERIVSANSAFARLFGYDREELAGLPKDNLYSPSQLVEFRRNVAHVSAAGHATFEVTYRRKDGSEFPAMIDATVVRNAAGTATYRILNVEDLTDRQRFEAELRQSQKMEAVGRLAGGVAHEINNALQGVLGFTSFALGSLPDAHPARADVEQSMRSGERARDIAWQLLAFSRRQMLKPELLDLGAVVAEFLPMLRQAVGPGRELTWERPPSVPPVSADRGQLEQVILNLVLNARDAVGSAGRIGVAVEVLDVNAQRLTADSALRAAQVAAGRYVMLRVTDNGAGMNEATRSRVFEPFFTTKGTGEGTGLGLAVAHGIIEQSGGRIWCASQPGQGTSFTVVLPEYDVSPSYPAPDDSADARAAGGSERVLVVDDEAHVRTFIRRELTSLGYDVHEAADGEAALAWCTSQGAAGSPIALVVTDLIMPRFGGRELGAEIKRRWPKVAMLYTSGFPGDEIARQGWLAKDEPFLQKPFTGNQLTSRVRQLLDAVR